MADSPDTLGRKASNRVGSREKILQAAATEFAQGGLAGARVDRIASAAGVNKAMIYYHFSSKDGLYREVIKQFIAERVIKMRDTLAGESNLEVVLRSAVEFHAGLLHDKPEVVRILLRELADPESVIVESIATTIRESGLPTELTKLLSNGARQGSYRPVDVRQAMISFISMSLGYFLLTPVFTRVWRLASEPTFVEERKAAIVDLFMNGVKSR